MAEGSIAGWVSVLALGILAGFALSSLRRFLWVDATDAAGVTAPKPASPAASESEKAAGSDVETTPGPDGSSPASSNSGDANADPVNETSPAPQPNPASAYSGALEEIDRELRATHALIAESDEEVRSIASDLTALDAAIRRLNARLRQILRETRQGSARGQDGAE